jgi:hypothetical protein
MSGGARRDHGSLEFAHARIGARWGALPHEAQWRRIEVTRELGPMLEIARATGLAPWLQGLTAEAGVHAAEHLWRRQWRSAVHELAAWMPHEWQPSIVWCVHLSDLAVVQLWAGGEPLPAWVADDPWLRTLVDQRPAASADAAWHALVAASRGDPAQVLPAWLATWRWRLPGGSGRHAIERELLPLVERHVQAFGSSSDTVDGWALRQALRARLVALLRRHAVQPLQAFAFLGLWALDAERLRAEVVARAAFPRRTLHS